MSPTPQTPTPPYQVADPGFPVEGHGPITGAWTSDMRVGGYVWWAWCVVEGGW